MNGDVSINLRPLDERDLTLLHKWLSAPHLKPYYMWKTISEDEVHSKFMPRINGDDPLRSLIAETGDIPFGYIQWYLNESFPDEGAALLGEKSGVSFDYFIGSTDHLGKQLGPHMLTNTISLAMQQTPEEHRTFFVQHHLTNTKAIRCSKRAGFVYQRKFTEDGVPHALYMCDERSSNS